MANGELSRNHVGIEAAAFALAAAGQVSLDDLVEFGTVRPAELWRWLDAARSSGAIVEAPGGDAGSFALAEADRQAALVTTAAPGDWAWLLAREHLVPSVVANARRAAERRQLTLASALFAGVVQHVRHDALAGGEVTWVDLVIESARRFRFVTWLDEHVLGRALESAVARGDRVAQALLHGARGFFLTKAGRSTDARDDLSRALDTAGSLQNRAVSFEVHLHVAYGQVLDGRPHEAIATFERFLGDVPDDILPLPPELTPPFDPFPEIALGVLGNTYGQVGQHGRGLDLLHRLRAAGTRLARPELVALADSLLCGLHAGRREFAPALRHAEAAFDYWRAHPTLPYFLWSASIALAWARTTEGRLSEVPAILDIGHRARVEAGLYYFAGSAFFEVLDRLDTAGVTPPPGVEIETEIDRVLSWDGRYMPAVAHRYRARRLARGPMTDARAAQITGHLEQCVSMLRESRAGAAEFARALDDAGRWARTCGRTEDADRLEAEARAAYAAIDLEPDAERRAEVDLAAAFLELGRLDAGTGPDDSPWGALAARLCATLAAERCALFEHTGSGVRVISARGGGRAWCAAVESIIATREPAEPMGIEPPLPDESASPAAQLLIVPFAAARVEYRGWLALENQHSRPRLTAADPRMLHLLGVQLGILTENLTIWRELIAARQRLEQENRYYRQSAPPPAAGGRIVGDSPALRRTLDLVARVARSATAVLIQGETGVGKELVAREIHRQSPRSGGPFIAVHIASLAPGLVASSLFGHERGAFTGATEQTRGRFELADGGTLFLDEVGELSAEDQVRLLRVIQEGTFERVGGSRPLRSDFRLVAATNRNLAHEVRDGRFREDLFYRLAAFPIEVPPLRERREEIPTLALYFMETLNRKLAVRFEGIGEADMARLLGYRWPGNVRELEHLIERAALLSEPPRLRIPPLQDVFEAQPADGDVLGTLEDAERRYVRALIARTAGRVSGPGGAAALAGLKASTFNWHVDKLGLRPELKRARADRP